MFTTPKKMQTTLLMIMRRKRGIRKRNKDRMRRVIMAARDHEEDKGEKEYKE